MKGALASAHSLEISNRDLELIHRTAVLKAARKKLDGKVAQTGGVISVGDVRAKALQHAEDELVKAIRVYEKALAMEQKKQQAPLNAEKKLWKGLFSEARSCIVARKKLEVDLRKRGRVIKKLVAYKINGRLSCRALVDKTTANGVARLRVRSDDYTWCQNQPKDTKAAWTSLKAAFLKEYVLDIPILPAAKILRIFRPNVQSETRQQGHCLIHRGGRTYPQ